MSRNSNKLDQKSTWIDSQGKTHVVARMNVDHAHNAALWLQKNAVSLLVQQEIDKGGDVSANVLARILANPPGEMAGTKLWMSLMKRAGQRKAGP